MPLKSDKYFTVLELALLLYKKGEFKEALGLILEAKELNRFDAALCHVGALSAFRLGDLPLATQLINDSITDAPDDAIHWNVLGEFHRLSGQPLEAIKAFQKAISLDAGIADVYSNLGNVYADADDYEDAVAAYRKALTVDPNHIDALFNLANVAFKAKRFSVALENYQKVLTIAPQHLGALNNYGLLLCDLKQFDEAERAFKQLLSLKPDFRDGILSYGKMLRQINRLDESLLFLNESLTRVPSPQNLPIHLLLGSMYRETGKREESKAAYQKALEVDPSNTEASNGVINLEIELGNFISARERLKAECARRPEDLNLQYALCFLQLQPIYSHESEILTARKAYTTALEELGSRIARLPQESLGIMFDIVGSAQPFYLPYQAMNDLELATQYGALISTTMQRALKVAPLPASVLIVGRKIKVGFVSGFFRSHSNYKIPLRGWLKDLDKEKFEVFGYHTQHRIDASTQEAERFCNHFRQGPKSLTEWIKIIQQDQLDVLIYPEIGMDPMSCRLACFRLAPHQATSWGHPTTSGLPCVDYFLSSDLMEPQDAQSHYRERLVRLPNLSFTYEPPVRPLVTLTRRDVGIRDDAFAYWCCQTNYKYLPQFDWVFPEIARNVPNAQFVFIQIQPESEASVAFRARITEAFKSKRLEAEKFVTYLPALDPENFSAVAALCDLALDSFEWSGCNSSLETLAQGTPIVTCPGAFMRSRHTEAILKRIDCVETIAKTPKDFVKKACELAKDPDKLSALRARVKSLISRAYQDPETVKGLQDTLITWTS